MPLDSLPPENVIENIPTQPALLATALFQYYHHTHLVNYKLNDYPTFRPAAPLRPHIANGYILYTILMVMMSLLILYSAVARCDIGDIQFPQTSSIKPLTYHIFIYGYSVPLIPLPFRP